MTNTIRWGILSTGRIARSFAEDMAFVSHSELVACCSRTEANARAYADRYQVTRVHRDESELLADAQVDAVYIASPHTFHARSAIAALRAGKAVLCEKPLVTSVDDCQKVIAVAQQTGSYLMEAMWTWFLPAIRKAIDWVSTGRIGELVEIKADFGYPQDYAAESRVYNKNLGGGTLLDMGIYPIALATLLLNRLPKLVYARAKYAPNGVEDHFSAILDYGDCMASIGSSFRCKLPNFGYLVGTRGWIKIPNFWQASSCDLYRLDEHIDSFVAERESVGLNFEIQAVVDDLRAGRTQSEIVDHQSSLRFQQIMSAIQTAFDNEHPPVGTVTQSS